MPVTQAIWLLFRLRSNIEHASDNYNNLHYNDREKNPRFLFGFFSYQNIPIFLESNESTKLLLQASAKMKCMEILHHFRLSWPIFARFDRVVFFLNSHILFIRKQQDRAKLQNRLSHIQPRAFYIPYLIYRPLTETSRPLPAWKLTDYIFVVQRRTKFERESAV